jgi:hypothetical protein
MDPAAVVRRPSARDVINATSTPSNQVYLVVFDDRFLWTVSLMEGVMTKLFFSLLAAVALTGAFIAEAVAAFPPNDWHPADKSRPFHWQ